MIILKSDGEIKKIKASCQLAAKVLNMIEPYVVPGRTTIELNDICHEFIIRQKAIPAPLNYRGFPKSICTSVNEVVCHGIPSAKDRLKDGDIVNVDVTTIFEGYHGDSSRTFFVGQIRNPLAVKLVECARECLERGILAVRPGCRVGDSGAAVEEYARSQGFTAVQEYVGHGIGKSFHEDPQIPHFGLRGQGTRLDKGMVFTIEPMINEGHWRTKTLKDGWTAVTQDGSLSAQFEHTIAIRNDGIVEVLSR